MTPFDLEISSFSTRLSRLKEKLAWTKRSKKGARFLRCVCNLRQRPVWPTGFFFNQTTLGVYSSRDEDWLRTNGRLGQTSPPSPFSSFVSDRPAIYPANIFQLFFHSASSLLFSNHRPTSIVPFIRGKTRHARSFSIVPPAFRFRLPLSLPTHPCPPPVICRENWLRNIFNCPSIFNGGKKKKKKKKIPDRSFLSIIFFLQNFKLTMHIYCTYRKLLFVSLSKIDFDKEEDVPTLESRETAERTGLAENGRRSEDLSKRSGMPVTWSPCRTIGRNPFYPQDRAKSRLSERCLVYLPACSPLLLSSTLFILEFVATGRKPRRHRREGRTRIRIAIFSSALPSLGHRGK